MDTIKTDATAPEATGNAVQTVVAAVITWSEKASTILLEGARDAMKATANAAQAVMDAASACDTLAVWDASVAHAKGTLKEEGRKWEDAGATFTQYVASVSSGWGKRLEISREVKDLLEVISSRGLNVPEKLAGQVLAYVQRPEGFLIPADNRYQTVTRFRDDMRLAKDLKSYLVSETERQAKEAKAKADGIAEGKAAAVAEAADRSGLGTSQGFASGTAGTAGTQLPEQVNAARMRLLNTLHALADTIDGLSEMMRDQAIGDVLAVLNTADQDLFYINERYRGEQDAPMDAFSEKVLAEAIAETEADQTATVPGFLRQAE